MTTTDKKAGLKRPGKPVNPTIKKQVARAFRNGKFGSQRGKRHMSVDVGYTSMTGLDLASINPNSISTIANGAWCWNLYPDWWFESCVPKPRKDDTMHDWAYWCLGIDLNHSIINQAWVEIVNVRYDR